MTPNIAAHHGANADDASSHFTWGASEHPVGVGGWLVAGDNGRGRGMHVGVGVGVHGAVGAGVGVGVRLRLRMRVWVWVWVWVSRILHVNLSFQPDNDCRLECVHFLE